MFDWVGVFLLVMGVSLFAWLVRRSWRSPRRWLKWSLCPLCSLLSLILFAALVTALVGFYRLNKRHDNPLTEIEVVSSAEAIARGKRYAMICAGCHSANERPPMGGNDFMEGEAPPVGRLLAPNLTPTHLADWTDGEIIRAIREGVHKDGRSLIVMPSTFFRNLSDDHVAAIVAYLRSQDRIEPDTPPTKVNVLGAIAINIFNALEVQEPVTEPVPDPTRGATVEYGEYLSSITCAFCHGRDLRGDDYWGGPDLTLSLPVWNEDHLITLVRTGIKPSGAKIDSTLMPFEILSEVLDNDDDLRAIHRYVSSLAKKAVEE